MNTQIKISVSMAAKAYKELRDNPDAEIQAVGEALGDADRIEIISDEEYNKEK